MSDTNSISEPVGRQLKVLVAIASYGESHLEYLRQIIHSYKVMAMDVDVVVLSEASKNLGEKVEIVVGLPSKNPWTLPFAHKKVFADRADRYDLFIYSEDDISVTEGNIKAFLKATEQLEPDEIAGFLRYEIDGFDTFLAEPWGHYHWKPESVKKRGDYTIAEFTNEHAGFYILTQWQLKQAILSGGFLCEPYKGRYNWPETAATDPYTNCGFRKAICISDLDNFLVHHMPNKWGKNLPISLVMFKAQIQKLMDIHYGNYPASTLCHVESKSFPSRWQKSYYEQPNEELLKQLPDNANTILTVGCGWGATEEKLQKRGAKVTALPLNSVIASIPANRGIEIVNGTLDECFKALDGRSFDCVLLTNLLHLQPDPKDLVEKCARVVGKGGTLILSGHNFDRLPWLIKRNCGVGEFRKLNKFQLGGISICGPEIFIKQIRNGGFQITDVKWLNHFAEFGCLRGNRIQLGKLTAREWVLQARR